MKTAKIKVNKTIYSVIKMVKDAEDSVGYTTYFLQKGTKVFKELVHERKSNEFTLWGGTRRTNLTMTIPKHIELIN
ncbi:MAG: hypothetical protein ABUK08_00430 [Candidatus Humimicrobiaceae bacterium]